MFKHVLCPQENTFVPKPVVNEPSLPPKPVEELKFVPGKDVLQYEALKGERPHSSASVRA